MNEWEFTEAHPDFTLFDSLPGAGDALVPRLIEALGSQRERFKCGGRNGRVPTQFPTEGKRWGPRATPAAARIYGFKNLTSFYAAETVN